MPSDDTQYTLPFDKIPNDLPRVWGSDTTKYGVRGESQLSQLGPGATKRGDWGLGTSAQEWAWTGAFRGEGFRADTSCYFVVSRSSA